MSSINHYTSEIRFSALLFAVVALSVWVSRYIPEAYFDSAVTPILVSATTAVALCCAWITFRHTEGYRPGWLNVCRALIQVLPMFALVALDYILPFHVRRGPGWPGLLLYVCFP